MEVDCCHCSPKRDEVMYECPQACCMTSKSRISTANLSSFSSRVSWILADLGWAWPTDLSRSGSCGQRGCALNTSQCAKPGQPRHLLLVAKAWKSGHENTCKPLVALYLLNFIDPSHMVEPKVKEGKKVFLFL